MKKLVLFAAILMALPQWVQAQDDDMYFVPTKKNVEKANARRYGVSSETYYAGSNRSVDEYNRRPGSSSYEVIDGDSTDVIDFSAEQGLYPDSVQDFKLTRQMARWDGYTPTDAYWQGYDQGRSDEWRASTWHSPWYYSSFYYPWYDSYWYWNDPWYYSSWRHGWYDPWYYSPRYYGWGAYYSWYSRPYYYGGGSPRPAGGKTMAGTHRHSNGGQSATSVNNWGRAGNARTTTGRTVAGAGNVRTTVAPSSSTNHTNGSWRAGNARSSSTTSSGSWSGGNASSRSSSSSSSSSGTWSSGSSSSSRSSSGSFGGGSRGGGGGRSGGRR